MIFVSTGGYRNQTAAKTALDFYNHGIYEIELSGGTYSATYESDLKAFPGDVCFQVHNYFPPPLEPFVFNLASEDAAIADLSMSHVRQAIKLAANLGRPIYSFHAGFRIDPQVGELGKKLLNRSMLNRMRALDLFSERVCRLATEARQFGVTLLVENNVLSMANLESYGDDPLLLTNPDEISSFMSSMPSNVGLLMDVAHLKVSSRTLGFNLTEAHEHIKGWIRGYHLSDNNGLSDSNNSVLENSWFWDYLVPGLDYYSLEVYGAKPSELLDQQRMTHCKILK